MEHMWRIDLEGDLQRLLGEPWWRHKMEALSALLALCVGNSPVTGEFPSQRPVTRTFGLSFDLRLTKGLGKQSRRRWFEMPSRSLWRHYNDSIDISTLAALISSFIFHNFTMLLDYIFDEILLVWTNLLKLYLCHSWLGAYCLVHF